jgi:predicted DNA-binding antitoxin AbrB/MazE fold protein
MNLEFEAVYENDVLKPCQQLPVASGQRVKLTLRLPGRAQASAGIFPWQGERKALDELLGPDNHPWNTDG